MVEGARLESVYTSKGYQGFESLFLRKTPQNEVKKLPYSRMRDRLPMPVPSDKKYPKKCEGWFFRDLRENVLSCGVWSGNEPENDGQAAPGN